MLRETVVVPAAGTYSKASLGYALARAGKRAEALTLFDELASRMKRRVRVARRVRDDSHRTRRL
jgi:hypothetical protein